MGDLARGRPVLIGTISIENSEKIAKLLRLRGIKHVVLNAKYHEKEAEIVAQAGRVGAVTIATNMAGRGTDILLGGNPEFLARKSLAEKGIKPGDTPVEEWDLAYAEALKVTTRDCKEEHDKVVELGGLIILGTERHESRRIDNQLRGRAGRQGDPGASRFYLSLDDDLMRIFAGDRMKAAMKKLGMEKGVPIESGLVTRSIERAQKQVEQRNFDVRKHLLEYDDVNNKQRKEIYGLRRGLLEGKEQKEYVMGRAQEIMQMLVEDHIRSPADPAEREIEQFRQQVREFFGFDPESVVPALAETAPDEILEKIWQHAETRYNEKEKRLTPDLLRQFERQVLLRTIDTTWKDHLLMMDHLKDGIGLRAYGQRDPLVEYKKESFKMFGEVRDRIENESVKFLFRAEPISEEERRAQDEKRRREQSQIFEAASRSASGVTARGGITTVERKTAKVGRNDACPCGSGKKFKRCHGS